MVSGHNLLAHGIQTLLAVDRVDSKVCFDATTHATKLP